MEDLSFTQVAGHCAYFIIFMSFLVRRMLTLRLLAIGASLLSLIYNYHAQSSPLWVPIQWNFLFIGVNVYHIVQIFLMQRPVQLSPLQAKIYEQAFKSMPIKDFRNFFEQGKTHTYQTGYTLITQGEARPSLFFIVQGSASIDIDSNIVNSLFENQFVGEMSFLTKNKSTATVKLAEDSKIHIWSHDTLDKYLKKNSGTLNMLHAAIGTQLIGHIIRKKSA